MEDGKLLELALEALVQTEDRTPCEQMASGTDGWCERHCTIEYRGPVRECWVEWLRRKEAKG